MAQTDPKKIPSRPPHPNPSQAEGDRETIDSALQKSGGENQKSQDQSKPSSGTSYRPTQNDPNDFGKVSPEEAIRIQSADLPGGEGGPTGWSEEEDQREKDRRKAG